MRLLFLTFRNRYTGLGHWHRAKTLGLAAREHHKVFWVSDCIPTNCDGFVYHLCHYRNWGELDRILAFVKPDWIIADVPVEFQELYTLAGRHKAKICILNGVGHEVGDQADLRIVQGLGEGKYSGVDYIILRPEIFLFQHSPKEHWFVYGGSGDLLKLETALHSTFPRQELRTMIGDVQPQALFPRESDYLPFSLMSEAKKAVCAMGMTVWELLTLGVPTYVFSATEGHLRFAQAMDRAGLIRAFPQVGLPSTQAVFKRFVEEPFEVADEGRPDKDAPRRVLELIEGFEGRKQ